MSLDVVCAKYIIAGTLLKRRCYRPPRAFRLFSVARFVGESFEMCLIIEADERGVCTGAFPGELHQRTVPDEIAQPIGAFIGEERADRAANHTAVGGDDDLLALMLAQYLHDRFANAGVEAVA